MHAVDELSGRMGAFDRLAKETPADEAWSRFDRVLESAAFLGDRHSTDRWCIRPRQSGEASAKRSAIHGRNRAMNVRLHDRRHAMRLLPGATTTQ